MKLGGLELGDGALSFESPVKKLSLMHYESNKGGKCIELNNLRSVRG